MARTKASVGAKVSSGKSSKARCSVAPVASSPVASGSNDKSRSGGGGNPVYPRDTPKWQRPITNFFINNHNGSQESDSDDEAAGSSKSKPKRNIIESDSETSPDNAKNTELDESIVLEELTGENSHKIEEYYPKGVDKGKGVGKKTKGKENVNGNIEKNQITEDKIPQESKSETEDKEVDRTDEREAGRSKREREERIEEGNSSKKIKVN